MPEVNFSMVIGNLAMEIKPADPVNVSKQSKPEFQVRSTDPETFDRVLDRIERRNPESKAGDTQPGVKSDGRREIGQDQVTEKSASKRSGHDEKSAKDSNQKDPTVGEESVISPVRDESAQNASNDAVDSTPPAEGQQGDTQPIMQNVGQESLAGRNDQLLPGVNLLPIFRIPFLMTSEEQTVLDAIPQVTNSTLPVSAETTAVEPGPSALPSTGIQSPELTGNTSLSPGEIDVETVVVLDRDLETPGNGTPVIQAANTRDGVQSRQQIEIPVDNQIRIDPTAISASRTIPESQWTSFIDIDELLNPTIRDNSTEYQARIPISRHVIDFDPSVRETRPQINPVPRNPETSRFEWRQPENQGTRLIENVGLQQSKPESVQQAAILEPLFRFSNVMRSLFEISEQNQQPATVVETGPIGQLSNAARSHAVLAGKFAVDSEMLVSDVREAVMRIASDGRGEARLVLHPPELGELIVRIESAKNGVVRAEFHTISPLVRDSLEAGLQRLTDALKAEGLTLEYANVHLDFGLGTEGEPGQANFGQNGSGFHGSADDPAVSAAQMNMDPVVERLPEGSTISVLA